MYHTIREEIASLFYKALHNLRKEKIFPASKDIERIPLEVPRNPTHGDLSSSIAFSLAKETGLTPYELAHKIVDLMEPDPGLVERVEVKGGGFINLFISPARILRYLKDFRGPVLPDIGKGEKVLIEFVSANPTGPLHIGHGRGAVLGDVLANLLEAIGYEVKREYYINDMGNQMRSLGESLKARYLQSIGEEPDWPEDGYKGEYLVKFALDLKEEKGEECRKEKTEFFTQYALEQLLEETRLTLSNIGVNFDRWISEKWIYGSGSLERLIELMKARDCVYTKEGALWFASTRSGDDKDRVLIRSDGVPTYFAMDLTYHLFKYQRGYRTLINVWGQDHHGYAPRITAALSNLGFEENLPKIILYQLVAIVRDGKPCTMSTREGEFITLDEVTQEVGRDALRFYLVMRGADTHLDFDLDLAKRRSMDNPVFYVQYAHARICSILRKAKGRGIRIPCEKDMDLSPLRLKEELDIILKIEGFGEEIVKYAKNYEPHPLTSYLIELASMFHSYYNHHRILVPSSSLRNARLVLVNAIKETIKKGLDLLGVQAPERM
jgi:arginyl-tRNA synthetase